MIWNEAIETMPRGPEEPPSERLVKLVRYIYERCPVYKQKLDKAGVSPGDSRALRILPNFLYHQTDMRDHYPMACFHGRSRILWKSMYPAALRATRLWSYTRDDLKLWGDVMARVLCCRSQTGRLRPECLRIRFVYRRLGFHYGAGDGVDHHSSLPGQTKRQLKIMQDFKPRSWSAPSYCLYMAEEAKN